MPNVTFDLPAAFDIASRGRTVSLDPSTLPLDVLTQALEHGLRQKIADAAASALADAYANALGDDIAKAATAADRKTWGDKNPDAVADAAEAAMQAAIGNLREHGWTVRTPGFGALSDVQKTAIGLVRAALKKKGGKAWKEYTGLPKVADKTAHLLAIAEKPDNWAKLEPMARKILAESGPDLDI